MNVIKTNNTKEKVRQLQHKLYRSANANGDRRFHALYDKIYRKDILMEAWRRVRANKGSAGIDNQSIEDIEAYGVDKFLDEIATTLKEGKYTPPPVRRVEIPKENGKKRPLGIPTVKDRVIQTAVKIVIEPIFETDFQDFSYGFRPKRNQHQALEVIRKACNNKGNYVIDADIKGYFDNINHDKLIKLIELKISDKRIVKLIKKWLKVGVMLEGKIERSEQGSAQGSSISPLLSNIYLNYMDKIWERHFKHLGKLVRFADDFVIICKNHKNAKLSFSKLEWIMSKLELTLSPEKTKIVSLWGGKEGFDFLGYHNRKTKQFTKKGQEYYSMEQWISKKRYNLKKQTIREVTNRSTLSQDMATIIKTMNLKIVGWRNYYGKSPSNLLFNWDKYIVKRLVYWYNKKRGKRRKGANFYDVGNLFYSQGLKRMVDVMQ